MMNMIDIRAGIAEDVFDYQQLTLLLKEYSKPRDRISQLLKTGDIIRIRKGLYTFSDILRRKPLCKEVLANLIYGPSYITAEYALSYYGLIPERVATVTSITTGRSCSFETPFGNFSYRKVIESVYICGATLEQAGESKFLIASPEKALIDKVWLDKSFAGRSNSEIESYLQDDLRIDFEQLNILDTERLKGVSVSCNRQKIKRLVNYLTNILENNNE
jgi:predicted transcriptional regulator of viral defense system